jgi:hypothetical protein
MISYQSMLQSVSNKQYVIKGVAGGIAGLSPCFSRQYTPHAWVNFVAPYAFMTRMTQSVFNKEAIKS